MTKKNKNKTLFSALALGASAMLLALVACSSSSSSSGGGSFSCTSKGPCPNDTAPTQQQIDSCNKAMSDANCGAKYKAAGDCAASQPASCDANGKSQSSSACGQQLADYLSCALTHAGDAGHD